MPSYLGVCLPFIKTVGYTLNRYGYNRDHAFDQDRNLVQNKNDFIIFSTSFVTIMKDPAPEPNS